MLSVNGKAVRYDFLAEDAGTVIFLPSRLAGHEARRDAALPLFRYPRLSPDLGQT
ncbi:hypothetical protein KKJ06_21050 [Xenorhabdus bovienii]|uniref:hypothetical protein n=1 Tax=Xenorhabdus bovienii TaxID=40576 RepID=UPI0023B2391C|nr:hypothetical protein [Xenorhabdus bovienii]MDE9557820.1 hypothetical protein [Xenorhabdus bovienii]